MVVPVVLTAALAFGAFAFYVDRSVSQDLIAGVDEELVRASSAGVGVGGAPGGPPGGPEGGPRPAGPQPDVAPVTTTDDGSVGLAAPVQFSFDGGVVRAAPGRELAPVVAELVTAGVDAELGIRTFVVGGERYRVRTSTGAVPGIVEVTALTLTEVDRSIASLRLRLAGGGFVIFVLQSVLLLAITTRVTRPVARIADAANNIADGHLDTPIPTDAGPRETAELAADLEVMLANLRTTMDATEQSATDARATRDAMERFLADAAHELRTPLTSLVGYAGLYDSGMLADPESLNRAMSRIGSESRRMTRLVEAMLQLARDGATAPDLNDPVDLVEVARDVVDDLRVANPGRAITRTGDAPTIVVGDAARLQQALLNLVVNACRHTAPDVAITVQVGEADGIATVSVIDHGVGIAPDNATRIFAPFFQVDAARAHTGGGAGLGLALVAQIVTAHDGTVEVHETPGGGATFVVTVPSAPSTQRPAARATR